MFPLLQALLGLLLVLYSSDVIAVFKGGSVTEHTCNSNTNLMENKQECFKRRLGWGFQSGCGNMKSMVLLRKLPRQLEEFSFSLTRFCRTQRVIFPNKDNLLILT